ncbi:LacI family DNA-binding transcriptional regulator [Actinomyces respiraculi]|uniref:LacI family DNA-binding transcriptional regulator n=1 Tax=Actinomyces respiraculi TaxID=2744574 RepID=UPI00141D8481|nr:LacI family DNA-binding transcriptional regulator [Actinomyces respiraculi]
MATLQDVARLAGVSAMTVSNVINGRAGKVSAATTARVMAAVEEVGYVPNASARSLASSASRIIALVYGAAPGRAALGSPYESLFVGACEERARDGGFALMLCGATRVTETIDQLRSWNVAGAVVMATTITTPRDFANRVTAPTVFVDAYEDLDDISYVNIDDVGGARLVGEKIAALGHRHVAFVGPSTVGSGVVRARLDGLRQGLAEYGVSLERRDVFLAEVDFEQGRAFAHRLAQGRSEITAVFASGDFLALGIVAGLRQCGLNVPGDVSVVGFDGLDISTYTDPPLTTVRQSVRDKATTAVDYLIEAIGGDEPILRGTVLPVTWAPGATLAGPPGPAAARAGAAT